MSVKLAALLTIGAVLASTFVPNTNRAKSLIAKVGDTVDLLKKRQKELGETVRRLSRDESGANLKSIAQAKSKLSLIERRIAALKQERMAIQKLGASYETGTQRMKRSMLHVGATVGFVGGMAAKPLRAAMEHESAMLGVVKQMDGLRDEKTKELTAAYYSMENRIREMTQKLPIQKNDIIGMFENAGQMGIKKEEDAAPFVYSVGKTAIALELDPKQAAEDMAKLSSIFQIAPKNIEGRLMDHINFLSDNSSAKGKQLIEILKGMGGTAKFVGMDERDSSALASVLMEVSSTPEIARTAGNALIRELAVANMQSKKFKQGLGALGLQAETVQTDMAKDATGTIIQVLEKIKQLPEAMRSTVTTQLFGKEYGDDVAKVAITVERLKALVEAVRDSAKVKDSVKKEFEAKEESYEYKVQRMKSQLEWLWVDLGKTFIGPMGTLVDTLSKWGKGLAGFAREYQGAFSALVYGLAGLVAGGVVAKVVTFFWGMGQAMRAMGAITAKVVNALQKKVRGLSGLEYELQVERDRRARHWRQGRRAVRRRQVTRSAHRLVGQGAGRMRQWFGRAGSWVGRRGLGASLRLWTMGARVLGLLSSAWKAVAASAGGAGRGIGAVFRVLSSGVRLAMGVLRVSPLGAAVGALTFAFGMLIKNRESLMWFFGDLRENLKDFGAVMREVRKDVEATIETVKQAVGSRYDAARSWTSDLIEKGANWWNGTTPVRADEPVITQRQMNEAAVPPGPSLPPLPAVAPRGAGAVGHQDNSTTTITINQQPGEDATALARRTAQELERARQARQRGAMYDAVPTF